MKHTPLRTIIAVLLAVAVFGQGLTFSQADDQTLTAAGSFKADEAVAPDAAIEISLNRALRPNEKIAITIGQTDLTGLFKASENRFVYDPKMIPLPVGTENVTVYLVGVSGSWKEIVRLPLLVESPKSKVPSPTTDVVKIESQTANQEEKKPEEVKTPENKTVETNPAEAKTEEKKAEEAKPEESKPAETKGEVTAEPAKADETKTEAATEPAETEETKTEAAAETPAPEKTRFFKFLPTFTISMESQPFQSNFPAETRPEKRATFTDFNLTGSIKTEGKIGGLTNESNFDFAGSSFKEKTLQFGTLAREAPDVDLSSYLMNFTVGKAKFSLGHTSFGNNRHLVSSFSSRGLSVNIPINKYFDVTGGIENGTSLLGFSNFLGMSQIRHQVQGATLGNRILSKAAECDAA